jgi:hypothetical protein
MPVSTIPSLLHSAQCPCWSPSPLVNDQRSPSRMSARVPAALLLHLTLPRPLTCSLWRSAVACLQSCLQIRTALACAPAAAPPCPRANRPPADCLPVVQPPGPHMFFSAWHAVFPHPNQCHKLQCGVHVEGRLVHVVIIAIIINLTCIVNYDDVC